MISFGTMASFYATQAYDCAPSVIWEILTDFHSWPRWFPEMSSLRLEDGSAAGPGATLLAYDRDKQRWSRWRIAQWNAPEQLVCHYEDTNTPLAGQVQAAYLQFGLLDEPEGCTLEVELGAEGTGFVGDLLVGTALGLSARRILPQLVDAFTDHVIERVAEGI
jgi:hypothetical protein